MIDEHTIKELYPLALAEGEGVGTAYEYFAKRLRLASWLKRLAHNPHLLIAGLPERYGSSLDFFLLASELGAKVTVVDDRQEAIEKAQSALTTAKSEGHLQDVHPRFELLDSLLSLSAIAHRFDVAVSSETLQRLAPDRRGKFVAAMMGLASQGAIFAPNAGNPDHTSQSGLSGLDLDELQSLAYPSSAVSRSPSKQFSVQVGYLDMPPFPPGITRTEEQRAHASSGKGEAMAMWGLGHYARLEKWLPLSWRMRKAHIVYVLFKVTLR